MSAQENVPSHHHHHGDIERAPSGGWLELFEVHLVPTHLFSLSRIFWEKLRHIISCSCNYNPKSKVASRSRTQIRSVARVNPSVPAIPICPSSKAHHNKTSNRFESRPPSLVAPTYPPSRTGKFRVSIADVISLLPCCREERIVYSPRPSTHPLQNPRRPNNRERRDCAASDSFSIQKLGNIPAAYRTSWT
jgi:hypothetical protein